MLVENQGFHQISLFLRDFSVGFDLGGVDDGHIQAGLGAVVEEDAVDGFTGNR